MGIVLLVSARNIDEFGGWTVISAPTPAVRLAVSLVIPVVNPTTMRINTTSRVTAKMLTVVRTGRALRPAMIICLFILDQARTAPFISLSRDAAAQPLRFEF